MERWRSIRGRTLLGWTLGVAILAVISWLWTSAGFAKLNRGGMRELGAAAVILTFPMWWLVGVLVIWGAFAASRQRGADLSEQGSGDEDRVS